MSVFDADRPLRVVVFFSGGASGFRYLAEHDSNYGETYEVVGGFSDDPDCEGVGRLRRRGIPVQTRDIRAFYAEREAETNNLDVRAEYDAETADRIAEFTPDVVLLSGYMWIVTAPLIDAYPLLNVHPADLTVQDDDGGRRYVGYDPVYDAVAAGEAVTRSSVHFVTEDVDEGPIVAISRPFEVHRELVETLADHGADDALRDYAGAHQEWMKWSGDGPALATALDLIATGRVEREGSAVRIDGRVGVYDCGTGAIRQGG